MSDTAEMIRGQMDETRLQLSDKLESLENQVSETVQSTGTAVNATVEAVQETVETVTGAVQDAVHSVGNAFDVPRSSTDIPGCSFGGSFVCGCLAVEYLTRSAQRPRQMPATSSLPGLAAEDAELGNGEAALQPVATSAAIMAAYESGARSSSWQQLRTIAMGAVIGIVRDIAAAPFRKSWATSAAVGATDRRQRPTTRYRRKRIAGGNSKQLDHFFQKTNE